MADDASILKGLLGGGPASSGSPGVSVGGGATSQTYWPGTKTTKTANKTYKVYMGQTKDGYDPQTSEPTHGSDQTMTESQAVASMSNWSADQLAKWKNTLIQNGVLKPGRATYAQLQSAWANAVDSAAQAYTVSGRKVTPYDIVDLMGSVNGGAGTSGGLAAGTSGGIAGGTKMTETDKAVDHVSNQEAATILNNAFEQAVGRMPTDTEREEFANRLHTAIMQNPSVTKTTSTLDAQGNIQRDVTSTGGFGSGGAVGFADSMAQQDAKADPEYGAYQASTTYFNALLSAIKSPT